MPGPWAVATLLRPHPHPPPPRHHRKLPSLQNRHRLHPAAPAPATRPRPRKVSLRPVLALRACRLFCRRLLAQGRGSSLPEYRVPRLLLEVARWPGPRQSWGRRRVRRPRVASRVQTGRSPLIVFACSMVKLNPKDNGGGVRCSDGGIGRYHLCYIGFMDPALP